MSTVTIIFKNVQNHEEPMELVDMPPTLCIYELFDKAKQYLEELQGQIPDISQIAFYLQNQPTVKLLPTLLLEELQKSSSQVKLVIVFPKPNRPLIQISLNDKEYFYVSEYTKFELLYVILYKEERCKEIITNKQFSQIKINGKRINFDKNQKIQSYLEGHSNSIVTISITTTSPPKEEMKGQSQPKNKDPSKQEEKSSPIKSQVRPPKNQQIKPAKVQQRLQVQQQEIKKQSPPLNQGKNHSISNKQNEIQILIKFQSHYGGSAGKQEHVLNVDSSSTLLSLLPKILAQLKDKGFDWEENDYQLNRDSDKLNIIYENTAFKKIDRPFKSMTKAKQIIFTFERHYQGGSL